MQFLVKYWYLIILAFVLSLVSAVIVLYMEKDKWIPEPVEAGDEPVIEAIPGMSEEYVRWNYEISKVDDLLLKVQGRAASQQEEMDDLQALRAQVQAEVQEMLDLRKEIDQMRADLEREFIEVSESEEANIKRLANVYSEMKPAAAVSIFSDLEIELVVKIISNMGEEPAARLLAEMSAGGPEDPRSRMAARVTAMIQKVK